VSGHMRAALSSPPGGARTPPCTNPRPSLPPAHRPCAPPPEPSWSAPTGAHPAASRDGAAASLPVNASFVCSARHASTACKRRTRGARCSGQCRYACIVVSTAPAQVLQCAQPQGPPRPYAPARAHSCAHSRATWPSPATQVPRPCTAPVSAQVLPQHRPVRLIAGVVGGGFRVVYAACPQLHNRAAAYAARARAQPPPPSRWDRALAPKPPGP
jgi:hypothetical protein